MYIGVLKEHFVINRRPDCKRRVLIDIRKTGALVAKSVLMLKKVLLLLCLVLVLAAAVFFSFAGSKTGGALFGTVVKVADGDTVTILDKDNKQYKIRLSGIDAPEHAQAFGNRARQQLALMVAGKSIRAGIVDKDRYGRFVCKIETDDNKDVGAAMLATGYAWHYKYFDKSQEYARLENEARAKKLGLWADPRAIAPWEYRQQKRK